MRNSVLVLLWLPMIVLGHVLSAFLFNHGSFGGYAFFVIWPIMNFVLAYKLCQKNGEILVIRLVSFFLVESAVLAMALLYLG